MPTREVIVLIKPIDSRAPSRGNTTARFYLSMKTFLLYAVTAIAEIVGCYLPWRWLKEGGSIWLLVPGALSLALFAWLLTLHGIHPGRHGDHRVPATRLMPHVYCSGSYAVHERFIRGFARGRCAGSRAAHVQLMPQSHGAHATAHTPSYLTPPR